MNDQHNINHRQLAWLTSSMITSGGILSLYNIHIRVSEGDAWLAYLCPLLYGFVIASFFVYLNRVFPNQNLFEITIRLLGHGIGTILNIVIIIHFLFIVMKDVYSLGIFTSVILLEETPLEIIILMICLLLMFYGQSNIEVVARVNDLFYPIFTLTLLCMPLFLYREIDPRLLTPVMVQPPLQSLISNALSLGSASDVFILGAFLHTLHNHVQFRAAMRYGVALGVFLLMIITILEIVVFGPEIPSHLLYTVYSLIRMIQITEFLDRVDLVLFSIWLPTIIVKIILSYLALLYGLSNIIKTKQTIRLNKPLALFLTVFTYYSFENSAALISFISFAMPAFVLSYQPLLLTLMCIAILVYRNKHKGTFSEASAHSVKNTPIAHHRTWKQSTMGLIVLSILLVFTGWYYSESFPLVANLCASGYVLSAFMIVLSTYYEMRTSTLISTQTKTP